MHVDCKHCGATFLIDPNRDINPDGSVTCASCMNDVMPPREEKKALVVHYKDEFRTSFYSYYDEETQSYLGYNSNKEIIEKSLKDRGYTDFIPAVKKMVPVIIPLESEE